MEEAALRVDMEQAVSAMAPLEHTAPAARFLANIPITDTMGVMKTSSMVERTTPKLQTSSIPTWQVPATLNKLIRVELAQVLLEVLLVQVLVTAPQTHLVPTVLAAVFPDQEQQLGLTSRTF